MNNTITALLISLQGLLISGALLRIRAEKGYPYRWLSLFLLLLSVLVLLSSDNGTIPETGFVELTSLIFYCIGPVLYAFIRSLSGFPIKRIILFLLFLPSLITLFIFFLSYTPVYNADPAYSFIEFFYGWNWIGAALLECACIILSFITLNRTLRVTENFSAGNEPLLAKKLLFFLTAYFLFYCVDLFLSIIGYFSNELYLQYNVIMTIISALWFSFVAYLLISDKERVRRFQRASVSMVKYQKSGVSQEEADRTLEKARNFLEQEKFYLENDCTLQHLADRLGVTLHELSQAINGGTGANFTFFIHQYRVRFAEEMLLDSSNNNLSILQVALKSGFSSKATFNRVFRLITGKTPTQYRKMQN